MDSCVILGRRQEKRERNVTGIGYRHNYHFYSLTVEADFYSDVGRVVGFFVRDPATLQYHVTMTSEDVTRYGDDILSLKIRGPSILGFIEIVKRLAKHLLIDAIDLTLTFGSYLS